MLIPSVSNNERKIIMNENTCELLNLKIFFKTNGTKNWMIFNEYKHEYRNDNADIDIFNLLRISFSPWKINRDEIWLSVGKTASGICFI